MGNVNKNWSYRKTDSHIPQYLIDIGFHREPEGEVGEEVVISVSCRMVARRGTCGIK